MMCPGGGMAPGGSGERYRWACARTTGSSERCPQQHVSPSQLPSVRAHGPGWVQAHRRTRDSLSGPPCPYRSPQCQGHQPSVAGINLQLKRSLRSQTSSVHVLPTPDHLNEADPLTWPFSQQFPMIQPKPQTHLNPV